MMGAAEHDLHQEASVPMLSPIIGRSRTIHHPIGPVAYDCVKLIFVRDGSAILLS